MCVKNSIMKSRYFIYCENGVGAFIEIPSAYSGEYLCKVQEDFSTKHHPLGDYGELFILHEDDRYSGIYTNYALSTGGAWYSVLSMPETTKRDISDLKMTLYRKFDVVNIQVIKIKKVVEYKCPLNIIEEKFDHKKHRDHYFYKKEFAFWVDFYLRYKRPFLKACGLSSQDINEKYLDDANQWGCHLPLWADKYKVAAMIDALKEVAGIFKQGVENAETVCIATSINH